MRHRLSTLLLVCFLSSCGTRDQLEVAPPTPGPATIKPTPARPIGTAQLTAPTTPPATPTPRPLAELPIAEALFQPGDLPEGIMAGLFSRKVRDWTKGMSSEMPPPDAAAFLPLERAGQAYGTGTVDAFFYNTPELVRANYAWLVENSGFQATGVPQPNIGDQAILFAATFDESISELIFTRCRAVVVIRLFESTEAQTILTYARRIDQRLDAVDCQGTAQPPIIESPPRRITDMLLFQPGDLPEGVTPGPVGQAQLMTDKMPNDLARPDRAISRAFEQAGNAHGYGSVAIYSYSGGQVVTPLYRWLTSWEYTQAIPQPGVGDQAVLFLPDHPSGYATLFFTICRTVAEVTFRAPVDQQALLSYAVRLAQRIDAVECQGATDVPILAPMPPVPEPPRAPPALIVNTSAATIQRLPDPEGARTIRAYSFADANHGWLALGTTIFSTDDGGTSWHEQYRTDSMVKAITFVSAQRGWIKTARGYVLTEDGGATWQHTDTILGDSTQQMPAPKDIDFCSSANPRMFVSISPQIGWMLCVSEPAAGSQWKQLFKTGDSGKHWQLIADTDWQRGDTLPIMGYARDLFFVDEQHGWFSEARGWLFATTDGGQSWHFAAALQNEDTWIDQLQFLSPTHGFAVAPVSSQQTLFRTTNGTDWQPIYIAPLPALRPYGPIQFFSDGSGIGEDEYANGAIYRTTDAGQTWTAIGTLRSGCAMYSAGISDLSFPDPQHGWATLTCAARPKPALYRTEDGGATWTSLGDLGMADDPPLGVSFVDQRIGYLVTESGLLWRTDDGGETFAPVDQIAAHTPNVAFATPAHGWELRGAQLFATTDGGRSWKQIVLSDPVRLFTLLPDGLGWALVDATEAAAAPTSACRLLVTGDGGRSWSALELGSIPSDQWHPEHDSIQFTDANHGWLRASTELYMTQDAGRSWVQMH